MFVWPVLIGGGYLITIWVPQWKSFGPWVIVVICLIVVGFTLWGRFAFGPWERIDLLGADGEEGPSATPVDDDSS